MITSCTVYLESFHIRILKLWRKKNLIDENRNIHRCVWHSSSISFALLNMNHWENFFSNGRSDLHLPFKIFEMWLLIVTKRLIFRQFLFSYLKELDDNGISKALVAEWSHLKKKLGSLNNICDRAIGFLQLLYLWWMYVYVNHWSFFHSHLSEYFLVKKILNHNKILYLLAIDRLTLIEDDQAMIY